MKNRSGMLVMAAVALLAISPLQSFAKPRPPGPPWPEEAVLHQWGFDDAFGSTNAVNLSLWAESWSGYAIIRAGQNVSPFNIPMGATNRWNATPDQGTIRVWYCPNWNSPAGPGHTATMLQLSAVSGANAMSVWTLYIAANGASIALDAQGDNGTETVLSQGISWTASQWHLITLSYSGSQTLLYVDDVLAASGGALPALPAPVAAANGWLTIGSTETGSQTAEGEFDELTTFFSPIKSAALANYYALRRPTVDMGPITPAEELTQQQKFAAARAAKAAGLTTESASELSSMAAQPMDQQQGLVLLTPSFAGTNILLKIQGGQTSQSYNILFTPSVFDNMTSADWATAAYGLFGQTNFSIPTLGNIGFYRVEVVNGVPVWQLADPGNTNSGFLNLTIDSPTNNAVIR